MKYAVIEKISCIVVDYIDDEIYNVITEDARRLCILDNDGDHLGSYYDIENKQFIKPPQTTEGCGCQYVNGEWVRDVLIAVIDSDSGIIIDELAKSDNQLDSDEMNYILKVGGNIGKNIDGVEFIE